MDIAVIAPALLLTFLAGLATAIGIVIAFFAPPTNLRFLSVALGFSAGVMIYVSFVELFPSASTALEGLVSSAHSIAVAALFAGMLVAAALDRLVPLGYNPHEMRVPDASPTQAGKADQLMRVGLLSALSITLHNLPEGLATFLTSLEDLHLGLPVAIAVGIHNIPEGIAISVPVYYATASRAQAFGWSALSGLSEPLGALLGLLVVATVWSDILLGLSLAAVAGIMIFIAFDVLLPAAETYGEHHLAVYALVAGMAVMALSLLLL
ncbi:MULTISPECIES: zinc transporter ZupT [Thiorhodovibrio]|uniref:zinc transporter ZupT n=1 Tax=Thiorhodovibrio TaxID=61593 RepID=UPI0019130FD4|nr:MULTISPECIES: zinc transporter ZupT [Thiorhodovibrio]MBK5969113.1 zinc transporter ZupT [Thiorhodovibrio winogradskyi]WPL13415.1 Zinc transporter ZupT [Thiorhodovibrio litoralis]